jgi:hypothetical protein
MENGMKLVYAVAVSAVLATPVWAQDQERDLGVAIFDLNASIYNLQGSRYSSGAWTDFNSFSANSVMVPNGQARFRLGNFIGEIQGTVTGNLDRGYYAGDDLVPNVEKDDISSSFGMIGHYVRERDEYNLAASLGFLGGQDAQESDGSTYSLVGAGVARDNWLIGVGNMHYIGGPTESGDGRLVNLNYLQGSYRHDFNDAFSLVAAGHYGRGAEQKERVDVSVYNIDLGVSYNFTDQVALTASVGRFALERGENDKKVEGTNVTLGLSIALGGVSKAARDSIQFDTPNLHREVTWMDEFR